MILVLERERGGEGIKYCLLYEHVSPLLRVPRWLNKLISESIEEIDNNEDVKRVIPLPLLSTLKIDPILSVSP